MGMISTNLSEQALQKYKVKSRSQTIQIKLPLSRFFVVFFFFFLGGGVGVDPRGYVT